MLDWVRACKGGDPSCSDFGSPSVCGVARAGCDRLALPGKLEWDSKNIRFANNAEANRYVKPVVRPGWELKV